MDKKNSSTPNIAFIVSIYGGDRLLYVKASIESLINQDYQNFSIYIYLDGPVHESVREYLDRLSVINNSIRIFDGIKNKGLSIGLNFLIEKILDNDSFKYVARMDADDIATSDRLSVQVEYMEKNPEITVVGGYCLEFGENFESNIRKLPLLNSELRVRSIARSPFIHPTVMFRMDLFKMNHIRYPDVNKGEDLELFRNLILRGFQLANIPKILLHFRIDTNTIQRRKAHGSVKELVYGMRFMIQTNQFTFRNTFRVVCRSIYKNLPASLMYYLWKVYR